MHSLDLVCVCVCLLVCAFVCVREREIAFVCVCARVHVSVCTSVKHCHWMQHWHTVAVCCSALQCAVCCVLLPCLHSTMRTVLQSFYYQRARRFQVAASCSRLQRVAASCRLQSSVAASVLSDHLVDNT